MVEVCSIQRNGMTMVTAPRTSTPCAARDDQRHVVDWRRRAGLATVRLLIVHPSILQPPLDQREGEDNDEKHPGRRRGIAHLEELEASLVNEIGDRDRRAVRSAARHDEDLIEYLK